MKPTPGGRIDTWHGQEPLRFAMVRARYVTTELGYAGPSSYVVSDANTIMGKWDWSH